MENIASYNVARKYEKRALLIAINAVAGLSIFFFGYDQGVMGGVNGNRDYAKIMGFGDFNTVTGIVDVKKPLLQGGIVSNSKNTTYVWNLCHSFDIRDSRLQYIISRAPSSALSLEVGLAIDTVVSRPSP